MLKTADLSEALLSTATTMRPLTEQDRAMLISNLIMGKVALDAYYETGHNFLASRNKNLVESDMLTLHKALTL